VDTTSVPYLVDAKERQDGSLILAGMGRHLLHPDGRLQDVWLLSIDSNGCETPGCSPTRVPPVIQPKAGFLVYPNPTTGTFTVRAPALGKAALYNYQGQLIENYKVMEGSNTFSLSPSVSSGIYLLRYQSADGQESQAVRIIYRP
jgi:hypothetical protein